MAQLHDITRLKAGVSVLYVLIHYGLFDGLRPDRDDLVGTCPLPGHGGDRSNRGAFRVTPAAGLWHCFTSCGGGDVVDLVRHLEGCDVAAAVRKLVQIEAGVPHSGVMPPIPLVSQPVPFQPFTKTLALVTTHPFLVAKGIRPKTARARSMISNWSPRTSGCLPGSSVADCESCDDSGAELPHCASRQKIKPKTRRPTATPQWAPTQSMSWTRTSSTPSSLLSRALAFSGNSRDCRENYEKIFSWSAPSRRRP